MKTKWDEPKIKAAFDAWIERAEDDAAGGVDCETAYAPEMTPIEQVVFFRLHAGEEDWKITPQKSIGKYRVDFLVQGFHFERVKTEEDLILSKFVIECDGHDFHERTKEQAQRDKKRDRVLQSMGYKVYRFTGSEIWRSDGWCVLEALGVKEYATN